MSHPTNHKPPFDETPAALLDQLVYIDNFMPHSDPNSFDLNMELAAFADDSFVFADEEKPKEGSQEQESERRSPQEPQVKMEHSMVNVPPGAQSTLEAAGLSKAQIDSLATLIAQHKTEDDPFSGSGSGTTSPSGFFQTSEPFSDANNMFAESNSTQNYSAYDSKDSSELDKRRRNTAASARFRIKKKLKEQEMEKNISMLKENSRKLEQKIQHLEMENRLLKNLVVERGAKRDSDELANLRKRAKLSLNTTN